MKEYDIKTTWMDAHKNNQAAMENTENIKKLMQKSHSRIISKMMNEFKLRIFIYSTSLLSIVAIMLYAFAFLEISLPLSGILPFVLGGIFLSYKIISEIIRFNFLKWQDDNKSLKDAAINNRTRLKRIKTIDFYINLGLCYGIATLFTLGYILNFGGFKIFFESTELSGLLIAFILILLILPWLMKSSNNKRYRELDLSFQSTLDFMNEEVP